MPLPLTLHQPPLISRMGLANLHTPVATPDRRVERPCGSGKSAGRAWRVCQDAHIRWRHAMSPYLKRTFTGATLTRTPALCPPGPLAHPISRTV